jgi:uncharacterized protein
MLLIKTSIKQSKGKGLGCFAAQAIKKEEIIYRDDPEFDRVFKKEDIEKLPKWKKDWFFEYAPQYDGVYYLNVDNARFINHSNTPNLKYNKETGEYKALRKIKIGEELTSNYREFDENCANGNFGFTVID